MISKVEICNFQSHKHTVLEFVPGTNVIIGLSDAGKSAVFRAINWVVTNRPLGDAFRSEWGGDTHVILHLDDGVVVERIRSASTNSYVLNGQELKAFGTEPPEPVVQALRMDPANVQSQGDLPFLLSASPGEAARLLNKAASLQEIDTAIANLKRSQLDTNKRLEINQAQREELEDQLSEFDNLPELEEQLEEIEALEDELRDKKIRFGDLSEDVDKVRNVQLRLKATDHIPALLGDYEEVEQEYAAFKERKVREKRLSDQLSFGRTLERRLAKTDSVNVQLRQCHFLAFEHEAFIARKERTADLRKLVRRLRNINEDLYNSQDIDQVIELTISTRSTLTEYTQAKTRYSSLAKIISLLENVALSVQYAEEEIRRLEEQYHSLMPDACPLCGEVITK